MRGHLVIREVLQRRLVAPNRCSRSTVSLAFSRGIQRTKKQLNADGRYRSASVEVIECERFGSSRWTRTSNPQVNSVTPVFGSRALRAGSSDENAVSCSVRQRIVRRLFSAVRTWTGDILGSFADSGPDRSALVWLCSCFRRWRRTLYARATASPSRMRPPSTTLALRASVPSNRSTMLLRTRWSC